MRNHDVALSSSDKSISIATIALAHGLTYPMLMGRPTGEIYRPFIEADLCGVQEYEALLVCFEPKEEVNASFMDETLVELAHRLTQDVYGERGLLVTGLNESAIFDLESAFALRRIKAHRAGRAEEFLASVVYVENAPKREWRLIGDLEPTLHEALREVGKREAISAAELAQILKIDVKASSTRLKRLHDRSLVWRKEQRMPSGREYLYHFWF